MSRIRVTLSFVSLMLAAHAGSTEISISSTELDNLGIRFESAEPVSAIPGTEATARVAIPPAGDAIVGAPLSGLLTSLVVATGDGVVEDQVLAELRSPDFIALQREFLDAFNNYLLARNEFERDEQLHSEGIISARRLQETMTRQRIAGASVNEHRQLLAIAGLTGAEIRSLQEEQHLFETLQVRAPFAGAVVERMATTGQRLDAMSPIYRLADLSELWLEISVPREKVAAIRPGMGVVVAGLGDEPVATVSTIGRAIDPATQFVVVRAILEGEAHGLSPGQFEAVSIVARHDDSVESGIRAVPVSAVIRSGDARFVFVRAGAGVEARQVDIAGSHAGRAYVTAGLGLREDVAVSGVSALKSLWLAQIESEAQ
jgi:cobalt-zinc-cadmium efflux system membrane fusion protein